MIRGKNEILERIEKRGEGSWKSREGDDGEGQRAGETVRAGRAREGWAIEVDGGEKLAVCL